MEEARNSESVEKGVIEIDTSQKEVMGRSSQRPIHINSDKVCQVTQVLMLGNLFISNVNFQIYLNMIRLGFLESYIKRPTLPGTSS